MLGVMVGFLTILACFAGMFAFAFGLSGVAGLVEVHPQSKKEGEPTKHTRHAFWWILDAFLSGGALGMMSMNWSSRPAERRLFCAGLACGVVTIALCVIIHQLS